MAEPSVRLFRKRCPDRTSPNALAFFATKCAKVPSAINSDLSGENCAIRTGANLPHMVSAIIVAAGRSQRMGFDKLLSRLGDKPVVVHSIEPFQQCDLVDEVMLVVSSDRRSEFQQLVDGFGLSKVNRLVDGGPERHLSVWNGISQLSGTCEIVAVHDAARPMVSPDLVRSYRHTGQRMRRRFSRRSDCGDLETSRSEPDTSLEALIVPDSGECKRRRSFGLTG